MSEKPLGLLADAASRSLLSLCSISGCTYTRGSPGQEKKDALVSGRPSHSRQNPEPPSVECLRFFRNKFYIPVFFSQTWKKRNLEIVCVRIILFLSFLFCVLAV
jgi:hypothetical protein